MARKKRQQDQASLPLITGEVWEIGRRALGVHITDLTDQSELPEVLLAVQTNDPGGVVLGEVVPSRAPSTVLADFVWQAMRQPLVGHPRRPEVIRVGSHSEAESLAVSLTTTGIALEVSSQLSTLDFFHEQMRLTLGGMTHDYRTQAAQAKEELNEAGLREFFRTARKFYREELWLAYGDEAMFEIALQPAHGPTRTLYGILLGNMGEEFGLALYRSLNDLQRFYDVSVEHLYQLAEPSPEVDAESFDPEQLQHEAEATAQFLQVPSVSLTYTPQRDVSPPLVQEAQHLKLPLANKSAFPLVMRTGHGSMQVATATDLADMLSALRAILDWDKQLAKMDPEDEIGISVTSKLQAVADFLPELTAHTTLQDNPCAPGMSDDLFRSECASLFESLLTESHSRTSSAPAKKVGKAPSSKKTKAPGKKAAAKGAGSNRVYTLEVYLVGGPISEAYADQEISRVVDIRGNQTLHDLHQAIFDAFERWEEHLYEFNLGEGPADRSQIYFYQGGWDSDEEDEGDPATTTLDALDLSVGQRFGYTFDMGDQWEHVIEVVGAKAARGKGQYPRVVKKVGTAPPQYPEDDDDEDME
jgi:hypothetical protein